MTKLLSPQIKKSKVSKAGRLHKDKDKKTLDRILLRSLTQSNFDGEQVEDCREQGQSYRRLNSEEVVYMKLRGKKERKQLLLKA